MQGEIIMPYEVKIKDVDTSETCKTTIDDLKELRELLDVLLKTIMI